MTRFYYCIMGFLFILLNTATAGKSHVAEEALIYGTDPISPRVTSSTTIPPRTSMGGSYLVTYTVTSNLPFAMPTPFNNTQHIVAPAGEFTITDNCHGKKLNPGGNCTLSFGLNARTAGSKLATVYLKYGNNSVPVTINTIAEAGALNSSWVGLIGVDYNPNHYPNGNQFNNHDVFYVSNVNNAAVTNVYAELAQLKAAGFTTVRSYQTVPYAWIDIIMQANALNMKVVYEADIPQNGSQVDINTAVGVLNSVIDAVGVATFQSTVTLVFAGHENYSSTDINYLTSAVSQIQTALSNKGVSNVPVGSAVVSGNFVTPSPQIATDMQTLINSYTSSAPLAFDPYPFQFGVTPPDQAVSNITLINSIAWDYAQVHSQSFYVAPRPLLMAETGWATSGSGSYAGYFCATQNNCAPSVSNAATYLTALYSFVSNKGNNSGALVFEAYDEPAKDPVHPDDAENFYGVFDTNCGLKNVNLLPNTSFSSATNPGCKGFTSGALFVIVGGSVTSQPQFTVQIQQTNPVTTNNASITATVPNKNRTDASIYPWPYFVLYNGAVVTMTGSGTGNSCSVTVTVINSATTFGAVTCTGANVVNCNNAMAACFLPNNF